MIRAFRPINLLVIVLVCLSFQFLATKIDDTISLFSQEFIAYTLVALSIAAGGYLTNGYYDRKIDEVNHPGYSFPFSKRQTFLLYAILAGLAIILGVIFFDLLTLIGFILMTISLLWMYSFWFKGLPIIGNGIIAFISFWLPVGLLYVNGASEQLGTDLASQFGMLLLGEIFLITFAREIIKDIQDVNGDKQFKCKTLPVRFGEKFAALSATFFLAWSFLIWFGIFTKYYKDLNILTIIICIALLGVILASILFLWLDKSWDKRAKTSSLILKIGMFAALLTLITL